MKLLLDTHIMLWWLRDNPKLGPRTRSVIARSDSRLLVSVASFWEISIKARKGQFDEPGSSLFTDAIAQGIEVVGVNSQHLEALERLPNDRVHDDPFDHLILAQTIVEGAFLVTSDRDLLKYDVPVLRAK